MSAADGRRKTSSTRSRNSLGAECRRKRFETRVLAVEVGSVVDVQDRRNAVQHGSFTTQLRLRGVECASFGQRVRQVAGLLGRHVARLVVGRAGSGDEGEREEEKPGGEMHPENLCTRTPVRHSAHIDEHHIPRMRLQPLNTNHP